MVLTYKTGDLFTSDADVLVNGVNCYGAMGAGIAVEFKRRFPDMYNIYKRACEDGYVKPGTVLVDRLSTPVIFNVAVKNHWQDPSKLEWVDSCLRTVVVQAREIKAKKVAMPMLGCGLGRLDRKDVLALMHKHFDNCGFEAEVWSLR